MEYEELAIQQAIDYSKDVPEEYQHITYKELLRHYLSATVQPKGTNDSKFHNNENLGILEGRQEWFLDIYQSIPDIHEIADGTRNQQSVWAVMELHKQGKPATTDEVRSIIKSVLGKTPETVSNTSGRLKKLTPKYLMREENEDGSYLYTPTRNATEVFLK